jgi:hypothetical protein
LLQQALAPDKMRIAFLLGAGCAVSVRLGLPDGGDKALIPDVAGLTKHIGDILGADAAHKTAYAALLKRLSGAAPNIEHILSHLRALYDVVRDGELGGLDQAALAALDARICELTTDVVEVDLPAHSTPYHQLAAWVGGVARTHAIEVFTPNYDLLVEQAFEAHKIPYFDGFVGARQAFFDLASVESDILPARWARLWKLHGSINWWRTTAEEVVRKSAKGGGDRQMIYPSHLKYDQSRRLPYLAMLDRLRDFLGRGQAVVVTCGYSFADQHLNEVIVNGLRSNATAMCFALLYGERKNYPDAMVQALKQPNLSVLASDGAVLGTIERAWRQDEQAGQPLHGLSVKGPAAPGAHCQFTLGDFKQFGAFLAQQLARGDATLDSHAA